MFGQKGLSIGVFSTLGIILYEGTRGYYVIAKSHAKAKESIMKVVKLPVMYAFVLGPIVNVLHIHIGGSLAGMFTYVSGAYTVLGMMILGVGLATVSRATFDKTFTAVTFGAKFVAYPLAMSLVVYLDSHALHLFTPEIYKIMLILSIVPMATNTVTYASYLKAHPEKTTFTVLLSTIFGLVYIPAFISLFLS